FYRRQFNQRHAIESAVIFKGVCLYEEPIYLRPQRDVAAIRPVASARLIGERHRLDPLAVITYILLHTDDERRQHQPKQAAQTQPQQHTPTASRQEPEAKR